MSLLKQVTRGGAVAGQRIVIAGAEKVGKTTLAMSAPNALLVPLEIDTVALQRYNHTPQITSWKQIEQLCEELIAAAKAGQIARGSSIVWDSGTALERLIEAHTLASDPGAIAAVMAGRPVPHTLNMETAHDGYGKAYKIARQTFERWLRYQDELAVYGGINCIVTCHVFAAKVVDPAHGEYDTWDLLLHSPKNQKTYGAREYITQWADMVGFLHEPMFVTKAEKGQQLTRGISANQGRVLGVERCPGWVAGNRYGMTGVIPIPQQDGWNALAHRIWEATQGGIDLFNRAVAPSNGA